MKTKVILRHERQKALKAAINSLYRSCIIIIQLYKYTKHHCYSRETRHSNPLLNNFLQGNKLTEIKYYKLTRTGHEHTNTENVGISNIHSALLYTIKIKRR